MLTTRGEKMTLEYKTHKDGIQLSYSDGMYSALQNIPFYKHVKPTMLPFIGTDYDNSTNKVLLVCKSFAAPDFEDANIQLNEPSDRWYSATAPEMCRFLGAPVPKDQGVGQVRSWLEAQNHLEEKDGWVWYKLADAMLEIKGLLFKSPPQRSDEQANRHCVYKHLALMNYLTRPATGKELVNLNSNYLSDEDKRNSYQTFKETVKELKPKFIFIFGKPAREEFYGGKEKDNDKEFTNFFSKEVIYKSPCSPSYKGWLKNNNGKELFHKTLCNNWGNDKW